MGNLFFRKHINKIERTNNYSDEEILNGIEGNNREVLEWLYKSYFDIIERMIKRLGGDHNDARDIFQEGIIVVYNRLLKKDFLLTSSFKTFFYRVCKNISSNHFKQKGILINADEVQPLEDLSVSLFEMKTDSRYYLYQRHFRRMNRDCQRLMLMYLTKIPVQKIATILGISVAAVKKRKYVCKEHLLKEIKNDPLYNQLRNDADK